MPGKNISVGLARAAALSAFLAHPEEWPALHIVAGVRPAADADVPGRGDEVFRLAQTLVGASPAGAVLELPPMHLDDQPERDRLVAHVRRTVRAAANLSGDEVLPLIGGFEFVGRWCHDARREQMTQLQDLRREADDAQAYRYGELGHVIRSLDDRHARWRSAACRLPGPRSLTWSALRELLLQDLDEQAVDVLVSSGVLELAGRRARDLRADARAAGRADG